MKARNLKFCSPFYKKYYIKLSQLKKNYVVLALKLWLCELLLSQKVKKKMFKPEKDQF